MQTRSNLNKETNLFTPNPGVRPKVVVKGVTGGRAGLVVLGCLVFWGCSPGSEQSEQSDEVPAKIENPAQEANLTTLTLTPEAEQRLGIETDLVRSDQLAETRTFAGEAVIPAGSSLSVVAPVAGTLTTPATAALVGQSVSHGQELFRLYPLERDLRGRNPLAETQGDLDESEARLQAAHQTVQRAEQLQRDRAGSVKLLEEAHTELALAEAARKAAQAQLEYLENSPMELGEGLAITSPAEGVLLQTYAASGQSVAAGSALAWIAKLDPVWIRVPVYVGELGGIDRSQPAIVHELGRSTGEGWARSASPVEAPPSADADAATVDLYYQLPNPNHSLSPGQRVSVTLRTHIESPSLAVPWSAIVRDASGGAWLYENPQPQTYVRRRVDVRRVDGNSAILSRGPAPGTRIVAVGAAELFGTEFGVEK